MNKPIVIAIDAMGGDNSPTKIIDGIELYHQKNKHVYFKLFGDSNIIEECLSKKYFKLSSSFLIQKLNG